MIKTLFPRQFAKSLGNRLSHRQDTPRNQGRSVPSSQVLKLQTPDRAGLPRHASNNFGK
jgi:hypothetical protein